MGKSDWELFNCSEQHEHDYVVSLYEVADRPKVRQFLKDKCADGTIKNSTHSQVYDLIKSKLGLTRS